MFAIYADSTLIWYQGVDEEGYHASDVKWEEEVNKSGSLEFTLPPSHRCYSTLQKLKTTITIKEDGVEIWKGRILHDEKDFYNCRKVFCEGQLSFLMDSVLRPYSSTESVENTLNYYLTQHNNQVNADRKILKGNVTVTDPNDYLPRESTVYPKTLNEITEKLVNSLGGYLIPRLESGKWYLDYKTSYDNTSDQVITFGENLLDVSEYITAENLFTILIPLGAKQETQDGTEGLRLTVESVNGGKDYIKNETAINLFGKITAIQEWDDVTDPSNLLTKGQEVLSANIEMSVTLTIKAVDLHYLDVNTDRIHLGDMTRVVSLPHELNTFFLCSKIVHDLENPSNDEYTFGTGFKGMTDQQIADSKKTTNAYYIAESASNTASNIDVSITTNYVTRTTFETFQSLVNSNFSTVNDGLLNACHYKGSVPAVASLPSSDQVIGDLWNVTDTGDNYIWDGSTWDKL